MVTPTTPAGIPTQRRQRRPLVRRPWTLAWNVIRWTFISVTVALICGAVGWAFSSPPFWRDSELSRAESIAQAGVLVLLASAALFALVASICHIHDKAQEEQRS